MNRKTMNQRLNTIAYAILSTGQLVTKRTLAHWRLLSYVVIGVVLASAILSGTVIYFEALRELALENSLAERSTEELDLNVRASRGPTNDEEYEKVRSVVEPLVDRHVGWMLRDRIHAGRTPTFYMSAPENADEARDGKDRTYFAFVQDIDQRIPIVEGSLPRSADPVPPGQLLELDALVSRQALDEFGAQVGDRFAAVPTFSSDIPHVVITISGVFDRLQADDDELVYFMDEVLQSTTGTTDLRVLPFFISRETFLAALGVSVGSMTTNYFWFLKTEPRFIDADNAALTVANIRVMNSRGAAALQTFTHTTALDDALIEYDQRLFFSRLPMFVVLILIALVILYYVATMASFVVENQRSEIALFRSRGSDAPQVLTVFVLEGAIIAVLATIVAPILAAFTIGILGLTPAFSGLTGGELLSVEISPSAYALSALGGILGFVAILIPAMQASRFAITQHRQQSSRPSALPAFQRYYLDVLLLLVAIFLFRQLTEQGSVVARDVFGAATADELLLAVPGLVLIASAMVLLRLFPLCMSLISKLFSRVMPAVAAMTTWQMSRQPAHYSRLSLLLVLTAGLGIFASSFGATLDRSFQERILHLTGSDVRVTGVNRSSTESSDAAIPSSGRFPAEHAYEQVAGVDTASAILRVPGRDLTRQEGGSIELIALNAANFDSVTWFRGDFSDEPLPDLLERIQPIETEQSTDGIPLPSDATSIGVKVRTDRIRATVRVVARLTNSIGQEESYQLGFLSSGEWLDLGVDLSQPDRPDREEFLAGEPLRLVSLYVEQANINVSLDAGSVMFDEVYAVSGSGKTLLDRFDSPEAWDVLKTTEASANDELQSSSDVFSQGGIDGGCEDGCGVFTWTRGEPYTPRGVFVGEEPPPVRVLASNAFLEREARAVGDEFEIAIDRVRIPVSIVGSIDLFPTITTRFKNYLIADLSALDAFTSSGLADQSFDPDEIWISSSTTAGTRLDLLDRLESVEGFDSISVLDREDRFQSRDARVDPLVAAGWRALLFIAFSSVLVLSCLGFLVHAYSSFRSRQMQFALMRTVGLSGGQLTVMMWLEQMAIIAIGLALGTWMGSRLGATVMPFLGHNDFGGMVIPPFVMVIDWGALLVTYAMMLAVFAVITLGLILLVRRLSLSRILRVGELG